jgi:hypothetical protein
LQQAGAQDRTAGESLSTGQSWEDLGRSGRQVADWGGGGGLDDSAIVPVARRRWPWQVAACKSGVWTRLLGLVLARAQTAWTEKNRTQALGYEPWLTSCRPWSWPVAGVWAEVKGFLIFEFFRVYSG